MQHATNRQATYEFGNQTVANQIFRLHMVLNMLMAALLGLLVFLIAVMDNPFRGEFSVGPDAFEYVRDRVIKTDGP